MEDKKDCKGHLKANCSGNCPTYKECLEISMGISLKIEIRD